MFLLRLSNINYFSYIKKCIYILLIVLLINLIDQDIVYYRLFYFNSMLDLSLFYTYSVNVSTLIVYKLVYYRDCFNLSLLFYIFGIFQSICLRYIYDFWIYVEGLFFEYGDVFKEYWDYIWSKYLDKLLYHTKKHRKMHRIKIPLYWKEQIKNIYFFYYMRGKGNFIRWVVYKFSFKSEGIHLILIYKYFKYWFLIGWYLWVDWLFTWINCLCYKLYLYGNIHVVYNKLLYYKDLFFFYYNNYFFLIERIKFYEKIQIVFVSITKLINKLYILNVYFNKYIYFFFYYKCFKYLLFWDFLNMIVFINAYIYHLFEVYLFDNLYEFEIYKIIFMNLLLLNAFINDIFGNIRDFVLIVFSIYDDSHSPREFGMTYNDTLLSAYKRKYIYKPIWVLKHSHTREDLTKFVLIAFNYGGFDYFLLNFYGLLYTERVDYFYVIYYLFKYWIMFGVISWVLFHIYGNMWKYTIKLKMGSDIFPIRFFERFGELYKYSLVDHIWLTDFKQFLSNDEEEYLFKDAVINKYFKDWKNLLYGSQMSMKKERALIRVYWLKRYKMIKEVVNVLYDKRYGISLKYLKKKNFWAPHRYMVSYLKKYRHWSSYMKTFKEFNKAFMLEYIFATKRDRTFYLRFAESAGDYFTWYRLMQKYSDVKNFEDLMNKNYNLYNHLTWKALYKYELGSENDFNWLVSRSWSIFTRIILLKTGKENIEEQEASRSIDKGLEWIEGVNKKYFNGFFFFLLSPWMHPYYFENLGYSIDQLENEVLDEASTVAYVPDILFIDLIDTEETELFLEYLWEELCKKYVRESFVIHEGKEYNLFYYGLGDVNSILYLYIYYFPGLALFTIFNVVMRSRAPKYFFYLQIWFLLIIKYFNFYWFISLLASDTLFLPRIVEPAAKGLDIKRYTYSYIYALSYYRLNYHQRYLYYLHVGNVCANKAFIFYFFILFPSWIDIMFCVGIIVLLLSLLYFYKNIIKVVPR